MVRPKRCKTEGSESVKTTRKVRVFVALLPRLPLPPAVSSTPPTRPQKVAQHGKGQEQIADRPSSLNVRSDTGSGQGGGAEC
jgi:hypothetical protein